MSQATPAQELREVARSIRERAEAASKGPWRAEMRPSSAADAVLGQHGNEIADCAYVNAAHIAGLHPGVALAVADWLDAAAEQGAYYEAGGAELHPDSYALKVARAYLGGDPQ